MNYQLYDTKFGKFLLNPLDLISDSLIRGNFWEEELLNIFNKYLNNESVIIEVGSYIGDHTVYLSKLCKKIYAFEGCNKNYYQLIANLFLNDCYNVEPYNIILGNGDAVKLVTLDDKNFRQVNWEYNAAEAMFIPGLDFKTMKLDDMSFPYINLIKIDAEGMDLNIMRGAKKLIQKDNPIVIFEYNECITEPYENYLNFLDSINYTVERISNWNYLATWKGKNGS